MLDISHTRIKFIFINSINENIVYANKQVF